MKIIILFGLSILCGILYAAGGRGHYWYRNTKIRDIFCAVVYILACVYLGYTSWVILLLSFILCVPALTTYWRVFTEQDRKSPNRVVPSSTNWFLHGLFIGASAIPLLWSGAVLWRLVVRCFALAFGMMAWSDYQDNAVKEEFGRGFLIIATMIIL